MRVIPMGLLSALGLIGLSAFLSAQGSVVYGAGTPGYQGKTPALEADSDLFSANSDFGLFVSQARPKAAGVIAFSAGKQVPPLDPGVKINIDLLQMYPILLIYSTADDGTAFVHLPIPPLAASSFGSHLYFQTFVVDAGAGAGLSSSKGLDATLLQSPGAGSTVPRSVGLWFQSNQDKTSQKTVALLNQWGAANLYTSVDFPYRHVKLPLGKERGFVADAKANLSVTSVDRGVWVATGSQGEKNFPNDPPRYDTQWGLQRAGGPVYLGPNAPRVSVIDSGIFATHEDLNGVVSHVWDFVDGDGDTSPVGAGDFRNHGTHVAGVIGAQVDNGKGITGMAALGPFATPQAWLASYRTFTSKGRTDINDCTKAMLEAVTKTKSKVLNLSWTSPVTIDTLRDTVKALAKKDVLMVAASGNLGNTANNTVLYPARYIETIAVGAVNNAENRPNWSSFGLQLDLAAPGDSILSTRETTAYKTESGTSFATPHVSAAAAIIWSFVRDDRMNKRTFVDRLLFAHAVRDIGPSGFDQDTGHGILDLSGELVLSRQDQSFLRGASGTRFPLKTPVPKFSGIDPQMESVEVTPDRDRLVYSKNGDIFLSGPKRLLPGTNLTNSLNANEGGPVVCPDGKRIYYTLIVSVNPSMSGIYGMNTDGSGKTKYSPVVTRGDLHISPDGKKLICAAHEGIWMIDLASKSSVKLVTGVWPVEYAQPRFSPDGTAIAVGRTIYPKTGLGPYTTDILILKASGTLMRALTKTGIGDGRFYMTQEPPPYWTGSSHMAPAWSPNGRFIYYVHFTSSPSGGKGTVRCYDLRSDKILRELDSPAQSKYPPKLVRLVTSRW